MDPLHSGGKVVDRVVMPRGLADEDSPSSTYSESRAGKRVVEIGDRLGIGVDCCPAGPALKTGFGLRTMSPAFGRRMASTCFGWRMISPGGGLVTITPGFLLDTRRDFSVTLTVVGFLVLGLLVSGRLVLTRSPENDFGVLALVVVGLVVMGVVVEGCLLGDDVAVLDIEEGGDDGGQWDSLEEIQRGMST